MAKTIELYKVRLFFTSTNLWQHTFIHIYVKLRCFKLLHYSVVICIRLLTFASSVQQRLPHGSVILWY